MYLNCTFFVCMFLSGENLDGVAVRNTLGDNSRVPPPHSCIAAVTDKLRVNIRLIIWDISLEQNSQLLSVLCAIVCCCFAFGPLQPSSTDSTILLQVVMLCHSMA